MLVYFSIPGEKGKREGRKEPKGLDEVVEMMSSWRKILSVMVKFDIAVDQTVSGMTETLVFID